MLERLARWCYRHRWRTTILWVAALASSIALMNAAGGEYTTDFSLPGSESQEAFDLLEEKFPARSGDVATIAFKADAGVADPGVRQTMEGVFAEVVQLDHVVEVTSPYSEQGAQQLSPDGLIAFADVQFDVGTGEIPLEVIQSLIDIGDGAEGPGLQVDFGGGPIQQAQFEPPGGAESIGFLAAVVILLVTFGSVLAMVLPLVTAGIGIGIGLSLILLMANFVNVPNFTPQVASMIGIGVGIDYALFIVTRYRQQLHEGMDPEQSIVRALTTSGRAVVFAGIIVVVSFLGILLMGFPFIEGIAVGGASAVLVTMLASITLLPALIGFVGHNIDRLHIPRLRRVETTGQRSFWFRWSRVIQRRPWTTGLVGLAVLVALTIPLFSIRLGLADAGNDPEELTTRRAYDLLSEGFGPGFNGPLILAAELAGPQDLEAFAGVSGAVQATQGVQFASPAIPNDPANPTAVIMTVYPSTSPQAVETEELVRRLRREVLPRATDGAGVDVLVGGFTAAGVDFTILSGDRLPILIGAVILVSFLLLMVVFRSLIVPIKAAIMNLLSIGAAYGIIVAVFQWGWLADLVGIGEPGPFEAWAPMMLFTILFGLSMDYEIFLLSRIREDYNRTRDNGLSVANGVATTGRVITAAAAIMIAVFMSFVLGFDIRQIKLLGLGLAVAVLVDATIVRMVLVPATMELLGDANWWLPKWLGRLIPKVSVEGEAEAALDAEYRRTLEEEGELDRGGTR
ncbi:MAG: MMPL family transporter [Actinobacteria bacterium]|nr:MMPL family transporter [Actinomycetota bacterium]